MDARDGSLVDPRLGPMTGQDDGRYQYSPLDSGDSHTSDGNRVYNRNRKYPSSGQYGAVPGVVNYDDHRELESLPADQYSETQSLLGSMDHGKASTPEKQDVMTRDMTRNVAVATIVASLTLFSYSLYADAFAQWLYHYFVQEVLGANASQVNSSHSNTDNPCYQDENNTSPFKAQLDEAQSRVSKFNVLTVVSSLLPAFVSNLLLGAYSDRIGRRFMFLIPMTGITLKYAITCVVVNWNLNVYILILGNFIDGASGTLIALFMGVYVYTADNTAKSSSRSLSMVLVQTVTKIFFALAHLGGGYFISADGYFWTIFTSFAISTVSLLATLIFLKETLERKGLGTWADFRQIVKNVFSWYIKESDNPNLKRKDFILLGIVFFMFGTCLGVTIQTFFLMNEPFCWGSKKIGYVTTFQGLIGAIASLLFTHLMQKFLSDEFICVLCLLSAAAGKYVLSFSQYDWMVYVAFTVGMLELIVLVVIRAIFSRMVSIEKRGSVFAGITLIELATLGASGAGFDALYSLTVGIWHGLTYFVIGCFCLLSAVFMMAYVIMIKRRNTAQLCVVGEIAVDGPSLYTGILNSPTDAQDEPVLDIAPQNTRQQGVII